MIEILHDIMIYDKVRFEENVKKGKYKTLLNTSEGSDAVGSFITFIAIIYIAAIIFFIVQYCLWLWFVTTLLLNFEKCGSFKIPLIIMAILGLYPLYGIIPIIIGSVIINSKKKVIT